MAKKKVVTKTGEQPLDAKQEKSQKKAFSLGTKRLQSEKTKRIVGLFLILLSLFLFIAFTSFLFSWKDDQSILVTPFWEYMFNREIQVQNILGKFGAWIANWLMHNNFGLAAFLFVVNLFVFGFKVGFNIKLLKAGRLVRNTIFNLLFIPFVLGYLFSSIPVLGGSLGYFLNTFFSSLLGKVGTGFLILFIGVSYAIVAFNISLKVLSGYFSPKENTNPEAKEKTEDSKFLDKLKNAELDVEEEPIIQEASVKEENLEPEEILETKEEPVKEETTSLELEIEPVKKEETPKVEDDGFEVIDTTTIEEKTVEEEPIPQAPVEQAEEETPELEVEVAPIIPEEELSDRKADRLMQDFGEYDPKLDLSSYRHPSVELLKNYETDNDTSEELKQKDLQENKEKIVTTLGNYGIGISKIKATIGPTVTLYEIIPEAGVRISKIKNLEDDIALSLSALGIRIIAPIPGKGTIGIEVPNSHPDIVAMRSLIKSEKFQNSKYELPIALGKTISNETFVTDLAKMPHLLMAGATGQGKSVGLNAILVSLLYKKHPSQIKFVLVDPKKVELSLFNKIERHFLAKLPDEEEAIITDTAKVVKTLNSLCIEMDARYELLKNAGVRNLKEYNVKFVQRKLNPENGHKYLPYIVLVVDEFADLIMTAGKEVEMPIARLAQLARAIGIHLIIATQRPSVNIITGTIKANFPARIAFRVTSKIDSRTILDAGGADQLIGRGDMLFSTGNELIRLQCGFVDTPEVDEITDFIGNQRAYPSAFMLPEVPDAEGDGMGDIDEADRDVLFEDAARIIVIHQQGSASLLQRKLKLGYNRAGRIVDQLEAAKIIGPFKGSKAREVLIPDELTLEQYLKGGE